MKKIVLSVLVAGSLLATSCKEVKKESTDLKGATVEAASTAADATKDAADTAVEGTKDAADAVVDAVKTASDEVKSVFDGISIPKFEDPKVTEFLQGYATHAKDYIEAKGDVLKNAKLAKKTVELAKEAKGIVSNLDEKAAA
jgi:sortase (surface protein transpeptidase)